jgi:hypothetical protein
MPCARRTPGKPITNALEQFFHWVAGRAVSLDEDERIRGTGKLWRYWLVFRRTNVVRCDLVTDSEQNRIHRIDLWKSGYLR